MRFSANPGVLAAGNQGKTYAEFQSHIASLAAGGSVGWTDPIGSFYAAGKYRATASTLSGTMFGTVWSGEKAAASSSISRCIQHGLPSGSEATSQASSGREIYFETVNPGTSTAFISLNRNGYTSSTDPGPAGARRIIDLIYWDGVQAQRMNPFAGTGPTPYDW